MPQYQCIRKCWRKAPGGVGNQLYHKGDYEIFANDREAGNHFLNIDSPKKEQADKRAVLLEDLQAELKILTRTEVKTPEGTMPVSPDAATRRKIKKLNDQIAKLIPKED